MSADKSSIRTDRRRARRTMTVAERLHAKQLLSVLGFEIVMRHLDLRSLPQGRSPAIAAYSPLVGEPDIRGLLNRVIAMGIDVYLPVSTPERPLDWALDDGRYRPSTVGGGLEPDGRTIGSSELLGAVGLVIVPALAVDVHGVRLGQGGGFYDRSFTELRRSLGGDGCALWAAVYDGEIVPAGGVPALPHDLRVDAALTPSGLTRLG